MSLDRLDPTCANCGTPASWHSSIDNACPDDGSPHPDSETYEIGLADGRFVRTTRLVEDLSDAERDELRALRHVEALPTLDDAANDELRLALHAAEARFNRAVRNFKAAQPLEDWTADPHSVAARAGIVAIREEQSERYLLAHPACTADVDETTGHLSHNGPTCPVHESGDDDRGDEAETDFVDRDALAEMDASELRQIINEGGPAALVDAATARLREIYPAWGLLDDLAATARTALADPAAVGLDNPDRLLADRYASNDDVIDCLGRNANYAVRLLDQIINTLNPAELDTTGAARALRVLGRQIGDLRDRMVKENLLDGRSLIVDMLDDVTDRILVDAVDALESGQA